MEYVDICPLVVVEQVAKADLRSSENSDLFSWIAQKGEKDCFMASILGIADRLRASSDPQVVDDFCNTVATYAEDLEPEALPRIEAAYKRFKYADHIAVNYFDGLRQTGIDIRKRLREVIREDWSFPHPRKNAATWHYYLYLASLDEPGALKKLADKISATEDGNDVTHLLQSLSELRVDGVEDILKLYANDTRRARGVEGPGQLVSKSVALFLRMREE